LLRRYSAWLLSILSELLLEVHAAAGARRSVFEAGVDTRSRLQVDFQFFLSCCAYMSSGWQYNAVFFQFFLSCCAAYYRFQSALPLSLSILSELLQFLSGYTEAEKEISFNSF
jgi:hypothetical protein